MEAEHIWSKVEKVKCVRDITALYARGKKETDVFDLDGLTEGKIYHPLGMAFQSFEDGTRELCYIIQDDNDKVSLRSTRNFRVVT